MHRFLVVGVAALAALALSAPAGGLDVARRRRGAPSVRPGLRPVRRRSAPWRRRRRTGRGRDPRTRRGNRHVRRVAPDAWPRRDDPDGGRLRRHARPPRHDRRREGRVRRRRRLDRDDGVERNARARRAERPPRHPARERRRRVRRPARASPAPGGSRSCADPGAGSGARTDAGPCPGPAAPPAPPGAIAAPTTGRARSVDGTCTAASADVRARRSGPACCRRGDTRSGRRSDAPGARLRRPPIRGAGRQRGLAEGAPRGRRGSRSPRRAFRTDAPAAADPGTEPARRRRCPSRRARRRRLARPPPGASRSQPARRTPWRPTRRDVVSVSGSASPAVSDSPAAPGSERRTASGDIGALDPTARTRPGMPSPCTAEPRRERSRPAEPHRAIRDGRRARRPARGGVPPRRASSRRRGSGEPPVESTWMEPLLPHDADLLRELDPAHRARVHDRGRGHLRAPPAAARS